MRVEPDCAVSRRRGRRDDLRRARPQLDGRAIDFLRGDQLPGARLQDYYGEPVTLDRSRATDTFFNGGAS